MLYNYLKFFHILSAAGILTSIIYSCQQWITTGQMLRVQTQTSSVIIPLAILQLLTGFTLISLKHYDLSVLWMSSLAAAFIVMMAAWISFVCFERHRLSMLAITWGSLFLMIFLMASRS